MSNDIENVKESKIKTMKEVRLPYLIYYVLSFVVLIFKVFVFTNTSLNHNTYRIGFIEFANGIGWIYYLANTFGLLTVFLKPLESIEKISIKIITIINLIVSFIILVFRVIPDTINTAQGFMDFIQNGSIAIGFWLILILHTIGFLVFWLKFIRSKISKTEE